MHDLKGINYKMISNTKWGAQPLLFVQKNAGWQSVLEPKSSPFRSWNLKEDENAWNHSEASCSVQKGCWKSCLHSWSPAHSFPVQFAKPMAVEAQHNVAEHPCLGGNNHRIGPAVVHKCPGPRYHRNWVGKTGTGYGSKLKTWGTADFRWF